MWNHAQTRPWNQPVLCNKGKVSCSKKQHGRWWVRTDDLYIMSQTPNPLCHDAAYEMCSHPPAMFDFLLLLRPPERPVLANAIWTLLTPNLIGQDQYVLDGGELGQRIQWTCGSAYNYIMQVVIMVIRAHPQKTHQRWADERTGATVTFEEDKLVIMKKDEFLKDSAKSNSSSPSKHMSGTSRFSNSSWVYMCTLTSFHAWDPWL